MLKINKYHTHSRIHTLAHTHCMYKWKVYAVLDYIVRVDTQHNYSTMGTKACRPALLGNVLTCGRDFSPGKSIRGLFTFLVDSLL